MSSSCREIQPLIETFVDGELTAEHTLAVEAHTATCVECAEHVEFSYALKASIQEVVAADTTVTAAFQTRLHQAVVAEIDREERLSSPYPSMQEGAPIALRPLRNRTVAGLLAVAAAMLVWLGTQPRARVSEEQLAYNGSRNAAQADMGVEQTLDRLIDYHTSPPRPQVTQPEMLPSFEADVGVRLQLPTFAHYNAQWEGANLVPVRNYQAASIRYRMLGHHVTVYVYDASKVRVDERLERRMVKDSPIYVGQWRGYSVATKEQRGTGYAAAADLTAQELEQIITEIH